jgi:hypothetical protein
VLLFKLSPVSSATVVMISIPFPTARRFSRQPQHIYHETVDPILNLKKE